MTNDESENSLIGRLNALFPALSRFHEWLLGFAALVSILITLDFYRDSGNLAAAAAPGIFWLLLLWRKPPVKGRKMWIFVTALWGFPLVWIVYLRLAQLLHL